MRGSSGQGLIGENETMKHESLEALLRFHFPEISDAEIDQRADDIRRFCQIVVTDLKLKSDRRQPPENLPTDPIRQISISKTESDSKTNHP